MEKERSKQEGLKKNLKKEQEAKKQVEVRLQSQLITSRKLELESKEFDIQQDQEMRKTMVQAQQVARQIISRALTPEERRNVFKQSNSNLIKNLNKVLKSLKQYLYLEQKISSFKSSINNKEKKYFNELTEIRKKMSRLQFYGDVSSVYRKNELETLSSNLGDLDRKYADTKQIRKQIVKMEKEKPQNLDFQLSQIFSSFIISTSKKAQRPISIAKNYTSLKNLQSMLAYLKSHPACNSYKEAFNRTVQNKAQILISKKDKS